MILRTRIGTYILLFLVVSTTITLIAMSWMAISERSHTLEQERIRRLKTIVSLVKAAIYDIDNESELSEFGLQKLVRRYSAETNVYLTVLAPSGKVLADSNTSPKQMANLKDLTEFRESMLGQYGVAVHQNSDYGVPMLMVAQRAVRDGNTIGFVRAGIPQSQLHSDPSNIPFLFGTIVLVVVISSILLIRAVEKSAIEPVAELTVACNELARSEYQQYLWSSGNDEIGKLVRSFQNMAISVTQREETLRDQANRIETVLGSMVEGVIAVNSDRVVLLSNDAVRTLLGIRAKNIVGRPLIEVTRIPALDQAVQRALTTSEPCSTEFEVTSPFRRVLSMQANRLPGHPSPGVVIVLHDMTELRRLENLRREFVANVSHELKTPLASIRAYAETLQLGAVHDAENRDYFLKQITDQSDRLHDLIMDMLQLARVEAGQEVFEITDVSINAVARSCVESLRESAAAKRIELVVDGADEDLFVRADEEGLRTMVGNLVDNAVKYSGKPGEVILRWRPKDENVEITVQDFGIGIPQDAQDRIFERFFRVDKARSREMGGTGLGLSIVKHLASSFGGSVVIKSELDKGSVFTILLKRSQILTN